LGDQRAARSKTIWACWLIQTDEQAIVAVKEHLRRHSCKRRGSPDGDLGCRGRKRPADDSPVALE
jgi:hypothetical protein